jgi:undecaprenyl-diphosphatase
VLAIALRGELGRDLHLQALALLPPAAIGLALERPIERRFGGLRAVAVAQIVAGAALFAADLRPEHRSQPDAIDHLAVGAAQAAALIPGVSRSGAAITAARLRGLSRESAAALALRSALPVTVGAGLLKGARAVREGVPAELRVPAAAGAAASFASALAALPLARGTRWRAIAAYRVALGIGALALAGRRAGRPLA